MIQQPTPEPTADGAKKPKNRITARMLTKKVAVKPLKAKIASPPKNSVDRARQS